MRIIARQTPKQITNKKQLDNIYRREYYEKT